METDDMPAMSGVRISAQTLHDVAISELHRGNRESALENLLSLLSLTTVYEEEPALVNYMIRIAILGLSQDACWDALQDPGWTDPQLARLQQAVDTTRTLRQLPRVVEAERAARVAHWRSFREHSYRHWIKRYGDLGKGFGIALPDFTRAPLAQRWREWGFHPLWQFARADQEELDDLQQSRSTLAAVTDSVSYSSWQHLTTRVKEIEQDYQHP